MPTPTPIAVEVRAALRRAMVEQGLTLQAVGQRCVPPMSRTQVHRLLQGRGGLSSGAIDRLGLALGVRVSVESAKV